MEKLDSSSESNSTESLVEMNRLNNLSEAFTNAELDLARFPIIEEGREYRSKQYKTVSKRVDIRIDGAMSSIEIV